MVFSVSLNDEDTKLFESYASVHGLSMEELFRTSVFERIEDEIDIKTYTEAIKEFEKDPVCLTFEDICKPYVG